MLHFGDGDLGVKCFLGHRKDGSAGGSIEISQPKEKYEPGSDFPPGEPKGTRHPLLYMGFTNPRVIDRFIEALELFKKEIEQPNSKEA